MVKYLHVIAVERRLTGINKDGKWLVQIVVVIFGRKNWDVVNVACGLILYCYYSVQWDLILCSKSNLGQYRQLRYYLPFS